MDLIEINKKGVVFTLGEAQRLLTLITKLTEEHKSRFDLILAKIDRVPAEDWQQHQQLDEQARSIVEAWSGKVAKLGGHPNGLWIVDFDAGDSYFCWKYPEERIQFWHPYDRGFSGRQRIAEA